VFKSFFAPANIQGHCLLSQNRRRQGGGGAAPPRSLVLWLALLCLIVLSVGHPSFLQSLSPAPGSPYSDKFSLNIPPSSVRGYGLHHTHTIPGVHKQVSCTGGICSASPRPFGVARLAVLCYERELAIVPVWHTSPSCHIPSVTVPRTWHGRGGVAAGSASRLARILPDEGHRPGQGHHLER
jgi:hypothetical protein